MFRSKSFKIFLENYNLGLTLSPMDIFQKPISIYKPFNQKLKGISNYNLRIYKDFKGAATMLEGCAAYMSNLAGNCKLLSKNLVNYRK